MRSGRKLVTVGESSAPGLIVAASFLAVAAGGCSPPDPPASGGSLIRADSAGIEIVTNLQPAWTDGEGWRVDAEPTLRIGQKDGSPEEMLHGVLTARRLGDSILVAQETEVRVYDDDGTFIRRLGGEGRGPGEFFRLAGVLPCSHGIVASELSPARLTLFSPSGDFGMVSLPSSSMQGFLNPLSPLLACTTTGVVGGLSGPPSTPQIPVDVVRNAGLVVHVELSGEGVDTLLSYPGAQTLSGLQVPFGRRSLIAASTSSLYVADTGQPEYRIHGLDGGLRRIVRVPLPERAVTPGDTERIRQQYLAGLPPTLEAEIQTRFDASPIPNTMPYFSQLQVAADGSVWLQHYQPFRDEQVTRWTVVDETDTWLGDIELPNGFIPHEFGRGEVLGVWRDAFGVEFVHRYAIR